MKSKITIIGDAGVGKTSLSTRLTENRFDPNSASTIGVHHFTKILNGKKFYIWDTAGQERFFSISRIYYKEASAIVIVFDSNDDPKNIEKSIDFWVKDVQKTFNYSRRNHESSDSFNYPRHNHESIPIYLFGNKFGESEIMESHKFLEKYPFPVFYVNAKTGKNVTKAFSKISEHFPEPNPDEEEDYFQESQVKDCCKTS